jgi:hypothetical protein
MSQADAAPPPHLADVRDEPFMLPEQHDVPRLVPAGIGLPVLTGRRVHQAPVGTPVCRFGIGGFHALSLCQPDQELAIMRV